MELLGMLLTLPLALVGMSFAGHHSGSDDDETRTEEEEQATDGDLLDAARG
ncbi:hypothetical protein [Gemmobacter lutimaris]|uniref:hypothetical protein n=1 Tax=Gemmobacter lutimaris TaxID=2306023 RepID=UPI0013147944|nr:hypothetical protein [Gemmobacter lutimaris]